jgi:thymidine kinase
LFSSSTRFSSRLVRRRHPALAADAPADGARRIAAVIRIPPRRGGWVEVICGPMFSGKSEEMIRRLRRAEIAGQRVVIFKPRIDDRFDASDVVSHAGIRMRGVPVSSVSELVTRARGFEVLGIDEVQFFEPSIVPAALELADRGTRVVAAGLDQDFRRLPFGPIPELLSHAEFVDKLQAVCHRCGGPATTTQRLVDGRPAPYSGETVVVGAAEQYEARCRDCHEPGADAALGTSAAA